MFALGINDLLHLKGQGQPFAEFVDRLIQATAFSCGISQDQVHRQLRAHIKDGGVDTRVDAPIQSPQGWFSGDTFWQYKISGGNGH